MNTSDSKIDESSHRRPTASLVLETNNLRAGDSESSVAEGVERLLHRLREQALSIDTLLELVITHDGLSAAVQERLGRAARRPIRFVLLPPDTGYYEAKNLGFDATTSEVVVFGDADCWPEPRWLELLLSPFADDRTRQVVAGRTTYRDDLLGMAATSIDFMYFEGPLGKNTTRNFYANNVAFRRSTFDRHRYRAAPGIYRGHCQRLGLALAESRIPILFVPEARTIHRFPDSRRELYRLRLLRGADTVEMAPHFARSILPRRLEWLGRLGAASALGVLGVRFGLSSRALGHQDQGPLEGAKKLAGLSAVAAISLCDAAGVLGKSTFGFDFGVHDGGFRKGALSYHQDRDRLEGGAGSKRISARAGSGPGRSLQVEPV